MLTLSPALGQRLLAATREAEHPPASWLRDAPSGLRRLRREAVVSSDPTDASLRRAGQALLNWEIHRGASIAVAADGPAVPGATVVLGIRIALAWAVAPCRVVEHLEERDCIGFTYASLPGHPELGVERFTFVRRDDALWFEVEAVSQPAWLSARLAPPVARLMQLHVTRRYLAAARAIGARR